MDADFWQNKWKNNDTGFHENEVNKHLLNSWQKLELKKGDTVFVPLCGKSNDMLWLARQGFSVVGAELSPLGVEAFFRENNLEVSQTAYEKNTLWENDNIKIFCGNFFDLGADSLSNIKAVYDRGALIALPGEMRKRYVQHLLRVLPKNFNSLLLTLEYSQKEMKGPPFSVSEEEIETLFGVNKKVTLLHKKGILKDFPRFMELGLTSLYEKVYFLSCS